MSPDWWRDCRDGIEKCSSPTGDGKNVVSVCNKFHAMIEKCSSPTGDGKNVLTAVTYSLTSIEKCSSPTGDGKL